MVAEVLEEMVITMGNPDTLVMLKAAATGITDEDEAINAVQAELLTVYQEAWVSRGVDPMNGMKYVRNAGFMVSDDRTEKEVRTRLSLALEELTECEHNTVLKAALGDAKFAELQKERDEMVATEQELQEELAGASQEQIQAIVKAISIAGRDLYENDLKGCKTKEEMEDKVKELPADKKKMLLRYYALEQMMMRQQKMMAQQGGQGGAHSHSHDGAPCGGHGHQAASGGGHSHSH